MVDRDPIHQVQRRVTGFHDIRLDGMSDLLGRASGGSVLDVGCNRGMVGFEFAHNGASVVHGVDNWDLGIEIARHIFADIRNVSFQFECVDLSKGPESLAAFGEQKWDFILLLAIVHKLYRVMPEHALRELLLHLGQRCNKYMVWRGGDDRLAFLDDVFGQAGLKRIHTTYLSTLGPGAIWAR